MFAIETDRLILRDLEESDLRPFFALASDPLVTRYQTYIRAEGLEQARAFILDAVKFNRAVPRDTYNLAIVRKQGGVFVGWLGSGPPEDGAPGAMSFGYGLSPQFWGLGYTTEAVRGMIDYTFLAHDVEKMYAECMLENPGSARVMQKAGMQLESTSAETDPATGREQINQRYQITRAAWRAKAHHARLPANLDEYRDPHLYDLENPDFGPDGAFYLSIAEKHPGPVLEIGCGTGRVTIPFAQRGFEITALDVLPAMLARAREKAGDLPIRWVEADARDFHLGRQFSLIFESGAVFMHMLTNSDQNAFLARVREHLALGGRFVVSLIFPHPARLRSNLEETEWYHYTGGDGRLVRVTGTDDYDPLRQVRAETALRRFTGADGSEEIRAAVLELRCTFPQEMERLLDQSGFVVLERYGGPERSPLTGESEHLVYVCALKLA